MRTARCPGCHQRRVVVRAGAGLRIRQHFTTFTPPGRPPLKRAFCAGSAAAVMPQQTAAVVADRARLEDQESSA